MGPPYREDAHDGLPSVRRQNVASNYGTRLRVASIGNLQRIAGVQRGILIDNRNRRALVTV